MKIVKYLAVGLTILSLNSCSGFFDTDSPSAMDVAVYKDAKQTEQVIAGIYNTFGEDKSFRNRMCGGYVAINTDIEYCNKNNGASAYANYTMGSAGTSDVSKSDGKDPWGYLNAAIERCNLAIKGIRENSDLTTPQFKYYLGEALFLRAFCYLTMTNYWGDVPARFLPLDVSDPNSIYSPKMDRNIIYAQIRSDLKEAIDNNYLPWSEECPGNANNYVGRPSKGAAIGLLARIDMMYAGKALRPTWSNGKTTGEYSVKYNLTDASQRQELYQEVCTYTAQEINHEDKKLQTSFKQVFVNICSDVETYDKTESLWEIPFVNSARGQVLNLIGLKVDTKVGATLINNTAGASHNSMICIVPSFAFSYADGDTRKDVTVCPFDWELIASGDEKYCPVSGAASGELYQKPSKISQMYLGKYRTEWMTRATGGSDDGINLCVLRYSDVLLMYAEAAIGGISGDVPSSLPLDGLAQLNKVHQRAGLSALASPYTMNDIKNERAWEFCGENLRKFDLIRWGLFATDLKQAQSEIEALRANTTTKDVYFHYKEDDSYASTGKAYIIDQIYGLKTAEIGQVPSSYVNSTDNGGWVKKSEFFTDGDTNKDFLLSSSYYLYDPTVADILENRQFWPIFTSNVSTSNGSLWNDYGY